MKADLRNGLEQVLMRQGTSDLAFGTVATCLAREFEADAVLVYTLDSTTGMLKLRCHSGVSPENAQGLRFMCMGKGLPGRAASNREAVQAAYDADSACVEEREALPEGSVFLPMVSGERLCGVLGIARHAQAPWAPDDVSTLSGVARLIATYLK